MRYINLHFSLLYFTLRPSLVFSITARHSSSGCQPYFAEWYEEWNYGTFAEGTTYIRLSGHHVGHRPTFQVTVIFITNTNTTFSL